MAYESDDEQIEALKNWWKENGTSVIVGVIVVLLVLFSSRQWQSMSTDNTEQASMLYQDMAEVIVVNAETPVIEEELERMKGLNEQLRTEYEDSIYTRFAALLMAKLYVEQDELALAADELNWVLDNPGLGLLKEADEELYLTARLRLARIVLSQGEAQAAIDLLREVEPGAFTGSFAELEGDAQLALGRIGDARSAYQLALESATNPDLLELKIADLSVSSEQLITVE
ncbi:tetratricopeptide repeat protein [Gammaproteobacteria bacterium]|nr:tetratricopeptide repeat protein [Gammaproteobacteria bacterium]